MGTTKTALFTQEQNETAALLKALAHPARVAIVQKLVQAGSCVCGQLVNELPLAQATVSQHLKELKLAGIIRGNVEGNQLCYCLEDAALTSLIQFLQHLQTAARQPNCC